VIDKNQYKQNSLLVINNILSQTIQNKNKNKSVIELLAWKVYELSSKSRVLTFLEKEYYNGKKKTHDISKFSINYAISVFYWGQPGLQMQQLWNR